MGRRKRGWFKVYDSILHNEKLNACDADTFRFYIRLLAMLNQTANDSGEITLSPGSMNLLACREKLRYSRCIASKGVLQGLYRLSTDGLQTTLLVPKWAELKGTSVRKSALKEEEKKRKEKVLTVDTPRPPPSEDAVLVTESLIAGVLQINPKARAAKKAISWAREYEKFMRLDDRSAEELQAQIAWLFGENQQSGFTFEVLCPTTHRKKFDRITLAMFKQPVANVRTAAQIEYDRAAKEIDERYGL